jgi:hypothetical protein
VITLLLLWLGNQRLGLSTGLENLCALVLRTPHLQRAKVAGSARARPRRHLPRARQGW